MKTIKHQTNKNFIKICILIITQISGVAVSNHLTPNDIQILFAGTPHGSSYGYVVTGQKHSGIIGAIEYLVEKLCPSIWLDRRCVNERQGFLAEILKIAKREGPVLLFPEGYCSNNSKVLQFRKAIFEDNVNIYPISIKWVPTELLITIIQIQTKPRVWGRVLVRRWVLLVSF